MVEGPWGDLLGLKGSGSHTLRFDHGHVPAHFVLEDQIMVDIDVSDPANVPGVALHGNPMYGGRALGIFTMCLGAVMVGAAYNALDEYREQLNTRSTLLPPFTPRRTDPDFQRIYGAALAKTATADAALRSAADQYMELCRRSVEGGPPFAWEADVRLGCICREVMVQTWETVQSDLVRTIGASLLRPGERIDRIFRDLAVANAHRNTSLRDWQFRELGMADLGIPREFPGGPLPSRPGA
jgi:3-hydroxy-9,10-secoandrosta-1,3,5(10)-triene-9,17-dione monooxygenase